jgi:hypothetical protein
MKRLGRIGLIALALAGVYLLLNGIGWAAVLFWKSETIAFCAAIPAAILCPAGAVGAEGSGLVIRQLNGTGVSEKLKDGENGE